MGKLYEANEKHVLNYVPLCLVAFNICLSKKFIFLVLISSLLETR